MRLPIVIEPVEREERTPAPHADKPAGRRALVADDNPDHAQSLAEVLRLAGNEVQVVHDGLALVEAAGRFRPQAAIVDIGMPRLNGYEAARRIRREPWGAAVKLIAQTGWGRDEDRRLALEAGFDAHLVKPADLDALMKLL